MQRNNVAHPKPYPQKLPLTSVNYDAARAAERQLSIMDEVRAAQRVHAAALEWLDATICHERIRNALLLRDAQRYEAQRRAGDTP